MKSLIIKKLVLGITISAVLITSTAQSVEASVMSDVTEGDVVDTEGEEIGVTGVPISVEEAYIDYVSSTSEEEVISLEEFADHEIESPVSDDIVNEEEKEGDEDASGMNTEEEEITTPELIETDNPDLTEENDKEIKEEIKEGVDENDELDELVKAYDTYCGMVGNHDVSYETFLEEYGRLEGISVSDYLNLLIKNVDTKRGLNNIMSRPNAAGTMSSSSVAGRYYYRTGSSLPASAKYGKYSLLKKVRKGDIIYESSGQ